MIKPPIIRFLACLHGLCLAGAAAAAPNLPLTVPLLAIRQELAQRFPQMKLAETPLQIALAPNLAANIHAIDGREPDGNPFTRILAPADWSGRIAFSFTPKVQPAGRYFVAYRPLNADGSPRGAYRMLTEAFFPKAVPYGTADQEPLHFGYLPLPAAGPDVRLAYATFGYKTGARPTLSVTQDGTVLISFDFSSLPSGCAVGMNLAQALAGLNTARTCGIVEQPGNGESRVTLVAALPGNFDPAKAQYSLAENATGKVLSQGLIAPIRNPSVAEWVARYDARIHSSGTDPHDFSRVGLGLLAFAGVPHADYLPKGFDFLEGRVRFADYLQMSAEFNQALDPGPPQPANRFLALTQKARALAQGDLQDPAALELESPPGNVLFADGYTRLDIDPALTAPWRDAAGTHDARLLIKASNNVELWVPDTVRGRFAFKPLLPALVDTLAAANPALDTNGYQITLPIDGPGLARLLKIGIYARGSRIAQNDQPFHIGLRLIRETDAGGGAVDWQPVSLDYLPSAGKMIAGPENSAFQIWPVERAGGTGGPRYVKSARFGHYLNRGQTRALAYATEYKLGQGIELQVAGPDSGKLTTLSQAFEDSGAAGRLVKLVRSGGDVGTGLGSVLFRALDYEIRGGDTVVLRAFEKKGCLFGLGLYLPDYGGSPDLWPVAVARDAVAPLALEYREDLGLPEELWLSGHLEVEMDEKARLYTSPTDQRPNTRLNELWDTRFPVTKTGKYQFYDFDLADTEARKILSSWDFGLEMVKSWAQGGEGNRRLRMVYRPEGEESRYLAEGIESEFAPRQCRARIAGDFVKTAADSADSVDRVDSADFKAKSSRMIKHWFSEFNFNSFDKRGEVRLPPFPRGFFRSSVAGRNNYKMTMDMVPVRMIAPSDRKYTMLFGNRTQTDLFAKRVGPELIYNRAYLFDSAQAEPMLGYGHWKLDEIPARSTYEWENPGDTLNLLIAGRAVGKGQLYAEVFLDGLSARTDSMTIAFTDFRKEIAIYTARYRKDLKQRDTLANEEGIDEYLWEDGFKLNSLGYAGSTYRIFPLASLPGYNGYSFGRISQFDTAAPLVVFSHGFNSSEDEGATFDTEKTLFKKLRLQGFTGNFAAFHWYGDFNPGGAENGGLLTGFLQGLGNAFYFSVDQLNAFKSSSAFLHLLADTLADFRHKTLLVHSLGNQVTMDMLRQNVFARPPGPVRDLGIKKYVMLEPALGVPTFEPVVGLDRRFTDSWDALFTDVPRNYFNMELYHLRHKSDFATGIFLRANENFLKIRGLRQVLNSAGMLLDDIGNAGKDGRIFICPDPLFVDHLREPRDLALCYKQLWWRTLPQTGLTINHWPKREEDEVEAYYQARNWEWQNSHSWLNLDEAYKTKYFVERILK